MIDGAVQIALAGKERHLEEWAKLIKRIKKRASKRNELAHLTAMANTSGKEIRLMLAPSVFDTRDNEGREYDVKEIREFGESFRKLAADLDEFWVTIPPVLP
jgi:hypothetical protein